MRDLFQKNREDWLLAARNTARKLLNSRLNITIEDVLEITPLPKYLHRNTIGKVFHDTDFVAVGYTLTRKPSSHSRVIRKWSLKQPTYKPAPTRKPRLFEDVA